MSWIVPAYPSSWCRCRLKATTGRRSATGYNALQPVPERSNHVILLALLLSSPIEDPPKPDKDGKLDLKQFKGIVLDDKVATKTGEWISTTDRKPFVGDGSLADGGKNRGKTKIRWTPEIPSAGRYRVKLVFKPGEDLASKVRVILFTPVGATHIDLNQR